MSAPAIYFTSDLHLFHDEVAFTRGFASVDAWHAHLGHHWWSTVRPKDQVWLLGDLTGGGHVGEALEFIGGLPGEKHILWGDYDGGHPMHRDSHRKMGEYLSVFASAQVAAQRRIGGRPVLLSHFPYQGDTAGHEDRHTQWRLRNEGLPLLHGHTHSSLVRLNQDNVIHVGWDAWGRLVPLPEVADLLA